LFGFKVSPEIALSGGTIRLIAYQMNRKCRDVEAHTKWKIVRHIGSEKNRRQRVGDCWKDGVD
jgi:hypothetical protein